MRFLYGCCAALLIAAPPVVSETVLTDLSAAERAAFGAEVRAYLLANPAVIAEALATRGAGYAGEAAADRARIEALAAQLFDPTLPGFGDGPVRVAFLTGDCAACAVAEQELRALAAKGGMRVRVLQAVDHPELVEALALDQLPSYVFDDLMVRGHVPIMVLERYVRDRFY